VAEVEVAEVAEVEEPAGCVSVEEVFAGTPWGAVVLVATTEATLAEEGTVVGDTASSVAWDTAVWDTAVWDTAVWDTAVWDTAAEADTKTHTYTVVGP
jgi:hypothetical protein